MTGIDTTDKREVELLRIDGSYLEGGGQIVRTALGLSTLLGKPFLITNIRKGRKVPGLKQQHMTAIRTLEKLCGAEVSLAENGSTELRYAPGDISRRVLTADIGTAGSTTLLLQSLWAPLLLRGPEGGRYRIRIRGGTDVRWSMPFDYMKEVFVPQLKRYADVDVKLIKRGFYPKGGGEIELKLKNRYTTDNQDRLGQAPQIRLGSQGRLMQIKGVSYATKDLQKAEVAERQKLAAQKLLRKYRTPVSIDVRYSESLSTGTGIVIWAIHSHRTDELDTENPIMLGADSLGEIGKSAEEVGEEAARKLIREVDSGAAADKNLTDNLIPFLALFGGEIKTSEITPHTRTNIYTVTRFLGDVLEVDEDTKMIRKK